MFSKLGGFGFGDSSNFGTSTAFAQNFGAPTAFSTQNTPTSSLFGSPATTTSGGLFGQPATFGQQSTGFSFNNTPSTSGGLFGQQPASSLFSQPASNAFSAKTPISSFGSFGTNTSSTNLFNRNQTSATIFGQSSNMFGSTTATGTSTKFQPPVGQDTMVKGGITNNINTRHQCISAMKEYEDKSLEELRLEDYQAGRKGKQQQQPLAQPQPQQPTSSSLFGTSTSQAATGFGFGQNKTTTTSGFGNARGNTSLFNQNRAPLTSTTGLFGQQTKPLFANPTDTGFSFNLNQNTGSSLFGQNQPQNKGLFGNTPQQSNLFSTTTNTPTFGSGTTGFTTNQASGNLFGNKQMAFSTPSTNTGFQFQNTGNNLFNKPATITPFPFGTNTSTGVFGASTVTNLFNNKPFGTNNTLNQGTNSFNFTNTGPNIFGNQPKPFGFNIGTGTGTGFSPSLGTGTGFNLGGNASTLGSHTMSLSGSTSEQGNLQQHLKLLTHNPYGDSSLFMNLNDSNIKTEDVLKPTNPTAQKAVLSSHYKVGTRPLARAKPKSLLPLISKKKMQIFDGLDEEDEFGFNGEDFSLKRNIKKLVVKNLSTSAKTSFNNNTKTNRNSNGKDEENNMSDGTQISSCTELNEKENDSVDSNQNSTQDNFNNNETEYEYSNVPSHPANIVLIRPGYYTVPSWNELIDITDENGDCIVEDFTIGREGYGSVFFPGLTNIAGMNFDEIVHFRKKEVTVYPDDIMKPEIGQGLNKRAEITLDCVWPVDKTTKTIISSPERLKVMNYEKRLENATISLGGQFLDYRPETGSWVFEVKHFSKYGLKDDDSEDEQPHDVAKAMKEIHQRNLSVQKQRIPPNVGTNANLNMPQVFIKAEMLEINDTDSVMPSTSQLPINGLITEDDAEMSDLIGLDYSQKGFEMESMENDEPIETFPHNLALELGVNTNNMQMMKASFFGESENDNVNENVSLQKKSEITPMIKIITSEKSYKPHLKRKDYIKLQRHTLSTKTSDISRPKKDVLEVTKLLSKSGQYSAVGMNLKKCTLYASSSVLQEIKSPMEITSLRNYSFRVGWGPNWTLVHVGSSISEVKATPGSNFSILSATGKTVSSKNWVVTIEKVNVCSYLTNDDQSIKAQQKWMLENQLNNSASKKEYKNPHFTPKCGIEALCKYAECAAQDDKNMTSHPDYQQVHHMKICWDLCVALWGKPLELDKGNANLSEYEYHQARKEAFSRWLAETEAETIAAEIEKNSTKDNGNLLNITSYLSGRQIQEACILAIKNGDNYLALLLAQAGGFNKLYKHFMQLQLQNYNQMVGAHISKERLKIFGLLAGEMIFEICDQQINVCENMNWKRALGLHLWYACSPTSVIFEALKRYDAAQMGNGQIGKYARPPVPPYLENNDDIDCESVKIYDTCYHLLQLYVNKAYLLEQTLSPTTTTVNHLDYRLSWHLCQVLQSLEYHHLSQYQKECINHSFAAQLESLDLWEWAIFVLTHIEDDKRRKATIRETLMRHASLSEDTDYLEREAFIVDKLFIPKEWVHYAKAIKAQYYNNYNQMARHLIKAKEYNKAHGLILKHIAPHAVINDNYHHLKKLLELLSPPEHSCKIQNWSTEGSVYLSYINLCEALAKFKKRDVDLSQLKIMSTALISFCPKIRNLPCHDAKDRLCLTEMSKNTSNIFRIFSMLLHQNDFDFKITNLLATQIENLEIPDECMEQETCQLTTF